LTRGPSIILQYVVLSRYPWLAL